MEVFVNHQAYNLEQVSVSVKGLLAYLGYKDVKGMALAINNQVIPKTEWPNHLLRPNDKVTLIKATQGG